MGSGASRDVQASLEATAVSVSATTVDGTSSSVAGSTTELGSSFDPFGLTSSGMFNYDGLKRIGRGSYGTVYLVRDKRVDQFYCLKHILPKDGGGASVLAPVASGARAPLCRRAEKPTVGS